MWFRLTGSPDRRGTARRFGAALEIVAAEGNTILILERYQGNLPPAAAGRAGGLGVVPRQVGQRSVGLVGHRKLLGRRTAAVRHDLCRAGHTSGLPAAKAAAELLSWRGRDLQDLAGSVRPHQWIYQDQQQGSAGACLCA